MALNHPDSKLHPDSRPGAVALTVPDLQRSLDFYTYRLGLGVHRNQDSIATLGAGGEDLLVLHQVPGTRQTRGTTGLYHFALLLPSRASLGVALAHLVESKTALQGASDHLVSEALYLADPDGNGIELYRDRPRDEWTFDAGGLRMATDPLDVEGLMAEGARSGEAWAGMPAGTVMGHVHLRVSDIPAAEHFYRDLLGLDLMTRFGSSASFLSAGGYHHHLATNTWGGVGAPPPPVDAAGLREWTLVVPDEEEVNRADHRLHAGGVKTERLKHGLWARDPSGNAVVVRTPAGAMK
jgi:catechol 2,3-dioxygenase